MKRRSRLVSAVLASAALTVGAAESAASITYVATYGSDANPCSLAVPCRSFAGALAQTSDGGQIVVLDSGGYGPVQIDKSVSIIAPEGVYAGISVFTGVGVTITVPAEVRLVGLNIVGFGSLGESGVHVAAGGPVSIERSTISGFGGGGSAIIYDDFPGSLRIVRSTLHSNTAGAVNTTVDIVIDHSRFIEGGLSGMHAGITDSLFAFTGVDIHGFGGTGHGWVDRSIFSDASLVVIGSAPPQSTSVSVSRSSFVRSGINVGTGLGGGIALMVEASTFVDNAGSAIRLSSNDPSERITLSNNVVLRNGGGATSFGSPIESRGNNTIRNNGTDGGPFVLVPGM